MRGFSVRVLGWRGVGGYFWNCSVYWYVFMGVMFGGRWLKAYIRHPRFFACVCEPIYACLAVITEAAFFLEKQGI